MRLNKATPIKVFMALSLGLASDESMPVPAERQIRFAHPSALQRMLCVQRRTIAGPAAGLAAWPARFTATFFELLSSSSGTRF